ncbi:MAG: Fic family protein [Burkholderiales bacterium]|nr:Fic family protein [Burkholderiales bacterium]
MKNDPQKPYNNLPILPPDFNFDDIDILKLTNRANIALSELNGTARTLPNRDLVFNPLAIREAVASSGVENIHTTVAEVFKADVLNKETLSFTDPRKETLHYKEALWKGVKLILDRGFLNTNDFIILQKILEPEKSGIRNISQTKEPVRIENGITHEVIYTPPEGEELIRVFLKNFEDFYNDNDSQEPDLLVKMAILHYQFEAIHPFRDGNGRTGRILMVLYLVLVKRLDLPFLFMSGYILGSKDIYYKLLREVTEKEKWKDWIIYVLNGVIKQANETNKIILSIRQLILDYKFKIKGTKLPSEARFIDYLFSKSYYTYKDLANSTGIHLNTAQKYLNLLAKDGMLKKDKVKKEVLFYNPELIKLLK